MSKSKKASALGMKPISSFFGSNAKKAEEPKVSVNETREREREEEEILKSKSVEQEERSETVVKEEAVEEHVDILRKGQKRKVIIDDDEVEDHDDRIEVSRQDLNAVDSDVQESPFSPQEQEQASESEEMVEMSDSEAREEIIELSPLKKAGAKKTSARPSKISKNFTKSTFHPINDSGCKFNAPIPYLIVCQYFDRLEKESGRLVKVDILSELFRAVIACNAKDLITIIYLAVNQIAPAYTGLELGVGDMIIMKAISESTGSSTKKLKDDLETIGDLALVAESKKSTQKPIFPPPPLTAANVFETFKKIANSGAANIKTSLIQKMMGAAKSIEIRFLVRALQGKMRMGCHESTVLSALAKALVLTPPKVYEPQASLQDVDQSYSLGAKVEDSIEDCLAVLKKVYSEVPNFELIISTILEKGVQDLPSYCFLTPGVPIKAMLAKPTKGINEILERLKNVLFTLEYKYDGERAQIHYLPDGTFKIFSRNSEDNTGKFPDIMEPLKNSLLQRKVKSCIIDSEIVAFDVESGKILPFQTLSTRKRKDVDATNIQVQVAVFAFDLLYFNGKSLLDTSLIKRRELLHASVQPDPGHIYLAEYMDTSDAEQIDKFLKVAVENNCEGLMVKTLEDNSTYEPDKRSHNWLKIKKDYLEGVTDTLDLVPIGAYYGKGKRTGVYGAYLLACYDRDNEVFQSICKIGTGFSDADLASLHESLKDLVIPKPTSSYQYPSNDVPDVFFEPKQVWEVLAADLSISPVHKAAIGLVDDSKGIALRFPRFIKVREDKSPEDATDAEQVVEMFTNQSQRK